MRSFDAMCLPKVKELTPQQIRKLRTANNASQAVFALVLNTSVSSVRQWEQGTKKPSGLGDENVEPRTRQRDKSTNGGVIAS